MAEEQSYSTRVSVIDDTGMPWAVPADHLVDHGLAFSALFQQPRGDEDAGRWVPDGVRRCPECGRETTQVRMCSDCEIDVVVGDVPGAFFRAEQAVEAAEGGDPR